MSIYIPGEEGPIIHDAQSAGLPSVEAAIQRRRRMPWGPVPQMLAFALNRRLYFPEQYPQVPHPRDYVPETHHHVAHALDVLDQIFRGF